MQYTKPNVLSTSKADSAIKSGAHGNIKQSVNADSLNMNVKNSTTSAYEADE
jgi:hypothetical protein